MGSRVIVQSLEISWHFVLVRAITWNRCWRLNGVQKSRKKNFHKKSVIQLAIHHMKNTFSGPGARRWSYPYFQGLTKKIRYILAQILDFNRSSIVFVRIPRFSKAWTNNICEILKRPINFISEPKDLGKCYSYDEWQVVLPIFYENLSFLIFGHHFVASIDS